MLKKKAHISLNISIIILSVKGLNTPITRLKKIFNDYMVLQESYFKYNDSQRLKVKEWKGYNMEMLIKKEYE